ncbi:NAD-dependent epimerase/dehydratase [Lophiostoma macrostomum CBS 122681]|uniref:NAD-dependent epimerase/dehydratase n=1 Tax=Lophiostoma macrostomum CBS 122681 TaxID=1314788 RepID=A0A6A6SL99_9PLEO|nr:NAD-dependent epimerase/dehydratase [Lophiostoma macrostomum CBS 122681]
MNTYAVLGSTGNCGTALIEVLLQSPTTKIHAFCRNKQKLLRSAPRVESNEQVEIFEGGIHDISLLAESLRGCHAGFLCISTNDNIPGCRMATDTAIGVIKALESLKEEQGEKQFRAPKLVLLSSASLDEQLHKNTPPLVHQLLLRSASYVYKDLVEAERILRAEQDWLSTIFIKPGGLSLDVQRGHALSFTEEKSPLSYLDLAAGMIEAVDDAEGKYDLRNVGVCYTSGEAKFPKGAPICMLMGVLRHYFPFLHPYLPSTGPA